jgi:hypothetical protein
MWFTHAFGDPGFRPEPKLPAEQQECVESPEYMKAWHMDLLNRWRDSVVRDGNRLYEAQDGERHKMSLTDTCLRCHSDHEQFCNQCHKFAGVDPYCWDCHIQPEGK